MTNITIWIHHKPETELGFDKNEITGELFKEYGEEIKERMNKIAYIVKKLKACGFEPYGMLYDIGFQKPSESEKDFNSFSETEMEDYLKEFLSEEYLDLINIEEYEE